MDSKTKENKPSDPKGHMGLILSIIGSVLLSTIAHIWTWYYDKQAYREEIALKTKDNEIGQLYHIVSAISETREVRTRIETECRYNPKNVNNKAFLLKAELARNHALYALANAEITAAYSLPESLIEKIHCFAEWDESFLPKEICLGKAATDEVFKNEELEIERLIKDFIKHKTEAPNKTSSVPDRRPRQKCVGRRTGQDQSVSNSSHSHK